MADPCPCGAQNSEVILNQLMLIGDANPHGNVHGGVLMKLMDDAGAICAMRHARATCVTVAIDSLEFHSPVHVGEVVRCRAHVTWVGRTSMEVHVEVHAEDAIQGRVTHTNSGYLVYVAIDREEKPVQVPPLLLETECDHRSWREAEARRQARLQKKTESVGPKTEGR